MTVHAKSKLIKVLVVDDSAFMRKVVAEMIGEAPDMEVVQKARNGIDALRKVEEYQPDVVTLDVEMPKMNGLDFLEKLMQIQTKAIPVIMLSSLTTKQSKTTIKALELGAVDFVAKPSGSISLDINIVQEELINKVRLAAKSKPRFLKRKLSKDKQERKRKKIIKKRSKYLPTNSDKFLVIGASTGGPRALKDVVTVLPNDLNAAVLIVQHMPAGFTTSLSERLNKLSNIRVKEAEDGDALEKGLALVAPGDYHMIVEEEKVKLVQTEKVHNVRPAVDVTMKSIVEEYGSNTVGVLLTGMGKDGAMGMKMIRDSGGQTIAQDEASCVVYGMPKVAYDIGGVDVVKPISLISDEIVKMINLGN